MKKILDWSCIFFWMILVLLTLLVLNLPRIEGAPVPIRPKVERAKGGFLFPHRDNEVIMVWGGPENYSAMEASPLPKNFKATKTVRVEAGWVTGYYKWCGWWGTYAWDPKARVFVVCETLSEPPGAVNCWSVWWATLDENGYGKVQGHFAGTDIRVYERKVEKLKHPPKGD